MRGRLFALGFCVALLFPIAAHFLVFLFSPPPEREDFGLGKYTYSVESGTGTKEARLQKAKEEDRKEDLYRQATKRHQATVFYAVYPMALAALVIGTFMRAAAVGAGLIFGGIFSLADGCYSSWDIVPGWVSLGSVILAAAVVISIGIVYEHRAVG